MKPGRPPEILIKRVYESASPGDGRRILAERLWPRGLRKDSAHLDGWMREVAPSTSLRQWFSHQPVRWPEFQRLYRIELESRPEAWQPILNAALKGRVTLLFSSRDTEHNNVVALRAFLMERLPSAVPSRSRRVPRAEGALKRKPAPRKSDGK